jgi:hypothetical protein
MKIRSTCACILMTNVILSVGGCSLWGPGSRGDAQSDSTSEGQSKSHAGEYRDIGSDGSIKPHPERSYQVTELPPNRTGDVIILGGPMPMPDLETGKTTTKGSSEGTTPSPGSVRDSRGSFGRTGGK